MSPTSAANLASLDGVITPATEALIPATDEGLIRGDGVFEVIRVYEGRPFAFEEHMARLERSASGIRLPVDVEAVRAEAHRLLASAGPGAPHECLRVVLTRGGRRLLLTEPLPPTPDRIRLGTVTYSPTRVLDGIKSLSYAGNMLASRLAREQGFDEALLVTPHGRVLEAPTSSLFWVKDACLYTPPLDDHILASITRSAVFSLAAVVERPCTMDDLAAADEAFLASTTREVQPVAAIDSIEFAAASPATDQIAAAFTEHVSSELGAGPDGSR